jgi:hypothetical protein
MTHGSGFGRTRRGVIGLLGLTALAGIVGPLRAANVRVITPPRAPMILRDRTARELADGGSGSIDTRFWGSIAPETGLMRGATREVTTTTERTSRRIVESWSLLPT